MESSPFYYNPTPFEQALNAARAENIPLLNQIIHHIIYEMNIEEFGGPEVFLLQTLATELLSYGYPDQVYNLVKNSKNCIRLNNIELFYVLNYNENKIKEIISIIKERSPNFNPEFFDLKEKAGHFLYKYGSNYDHYEYMTCEKLRKITLLEKKFTEYVNNLYDVEYIDYFNQKDKENMIILFENPIFRTSFNERIQLYPYIMTKKWFYDSEGFKFLLNYTDEEIKIIQPIYKIYLAYEDKKLKPIRDVIRAIFMIRGISNDLIEEIQKFFMVKKR